MTKDTEFEILLRVAVAKSIENEIEAFDKLETTEEHVSTRSRRRFYRALRRETLKDSATLIAIKRVAVACMAVITIGFGVCMTIQPVRVAFWNAIVTWYEDYVAVLFEPEEEMPTTIEEQITPVVPDGWICEVIKSNEINYSCLLIGPNGEQVFYSQSVYSGGEERFDDNCIIENIVLDNEINAILFTLDDGSISVTFKSKYVFEVLGYDISKEALLEIVNGIN